MATIEKRGETYRITVSAGYDSGGKQVRRKTTWKPPENLTPKRLEKELNKFVTDFEERVKRDGCKYDGNIKFEAFAAVWLDYVKHRGKMKPLSIQRLEACQARTFKAIGHKRLKDITRGNIQDFIDNLAEDGINQHTGGGLSEKTQRHYLNYISDVFTYARKCSIAVDNPCKDIDLNGAAKQERTCYDLEETQRFLDLLTEQAPLKYRAFFTLAIYGGFRRGELLGFEWKDIDFDNRIISVVRTSLRDRESGGMITGTPKTKSSTRSLKLPAEVFELLKSYKAEQARERLRIGDKWIDNDRLFTTWDGQPMGENTPNIWLKKFCVANDLPKTTIHSFRHLNASLLIINGVDAKTVSATLGHSQVTTTLNIYAHSFQEAQARASETIANALPFKKDSAKQA